MRKELIAAILLLARGLGAYADDNTPVRMADIPKEVQQCILISTNPENRDLVKMVLDPECAKNLSDEDQKRATEVFHSMHGTTVMGGPMVMQ